ncbi:unnamed protein product [Rhizophagus irregularis]|nr:unnamed protein product [Rhizophagus irregularis]
MLWQISSGLEAIHNANYIHRDFHSGNILLDEITCFVGDLGLSQPAANTSNNEIYGITKPHPKAIYTNYISNELDFDIDISRTNALGIKRKIEDINIDFHENSGKSIKISFGYSRTSLTDRK